jgi:hypothetical protein
MVRFISYPVDCHQKQRRVELRSNNLIVKVVGMDAPEFGVGEGPAKVVSVSLPEGTVTALRELAGPRGLSAMVDAAVQQYLRNRLTAAELDDYQRQHGAFTPADRQAAADVWADAERIAVRAAETGQWPANG